MRNKNHGFDVTVVYDQSGDGDYTEIRVVGEISPYIPPTGPSMESAGGDPAEGGEIEYYQIFDKSSGKEIEDDDGRILDAVMDDVYEKASEAEGK